MVDFAASFPFQWFLGDFLSDSDSEEVDWSDAEVSLKLFRVSRGLRVLRLLRLAKLKRIAITIEDYIASTTVANVFLLLRLLFVVSLLAHWTACLWFFVSSREMMTGQQTWVGRLHAESTVERYVTAVYFSVATMTTVGYGDVHPYTRTESIFAIFTMILACGEFAYAVSSINSLFTKSAADESEYRLRLTAVKRFMRKKSVPKPTQKRVEGYLEYVWDRQQSLLLREKEIVELLSSTLKVEIYSHVHGAVLTSCYAFRSFETAVVASLSNLIESESFAPSDIIFQEDEKSTKIYFVDYGTVRIYHQASGSQYTLLQRGAYFGEIAFFLERQRCAAAACLTFVDLLSLKRAHLLAASDKYPMTKALMHKYACKCASGDLSLLEVRCYACNATGHVARVCGKLAIDLTSEAHRLLSHSKLISCNRYYKPNFNRLQRPKLKVSYQARNVVGLPSTIRELFGDNSRLLRLARDYDEKSESMDSSIHLQSIRLMSEDILEKKPDLSNILESEDESEAVRSGVRERRFRRSLLRRVPVETGSSTIENFYRQERQIPSAKETEVDRWPREELLRPMETDDFSFRELPYRRRIPRTLTVPYGSSMD